MLILSLTACGKIKTQSPVSGYDPPDELGSIEAPAWLWEFPSGSYAIGFAFQDSHFGAKADSLAKEYAAVVLSRNHSSFVVDKKAIYEWADEQNSNSKEAKLQLVVSADLPYLQKAHQDLIRLDFTEQMGYYIALYGFIDGAVRNDIRKMHGDQIPAWCEENTVRQEGKVIHAVASDIAANLPDAWALAHEKALRLIGKYRLQKVAASLQNDDSLVIRKFEDETVSITYKAYLDKCFIIPITKEGMQSFKVYLSLRSQDLR